MGRTMKNNRGFSLIELLIVFAIMAVMGVIAFNIFGGMVENSRIRADEQQASNIEKVLTTYIVDSGDYSLTKMATDADGTTNLIGTGNGTETDTLIADLQAVIYFKTANGDVKQYGPLLTPPPGKNASFDNYKPQYNGYDGYKIEINAAKKYVKVTPSKDNVFSVIP